MENKNVSYRFMVNGFLVEASYPVSFIEDVMKPLIRSWNQIYQQKKQRVVVFLAAPPATGKSTLAMLIAALSRSMEDSMTIQDVGMDGFHHYQRYILSHEVEVEGRRIPMKEVKGCPESFDYERFEHMVHLLSQTNVLWPRYDRVKHDVEDDAIVVDAPIVLIEGNYLLLDEAPWRNLSALCDDSIFIDADQQMLSRRLIKRKMMGGMPPHEAIAFCNQSDMKNVERILAHRFIAKHNWYYDGKTYTIQGKEDELC